MVVSGPLDAIMDNLDHEHRVRQKVQEIYDHALNLLVSAETESVKFILQLCREILDDD